MVKTTLKYLAGSLILAAIVSTGCSDNLPTGTKGSVIMPLKEGNMWIGRLTQYDADGNVRTSEPDTIKVFDFKERASRYGDEIRWLHGGLIYEEVAENRQDGLHVTSAYDPDRRHMRLQAKYPASPLDTFDSKIGTTIVVSVNETVTVPAGTYRCYHYVPAYLAPGAAIDGHRHSATAMQRYFVPDLGPVRIDVYRWNWTTKKYWFSRRWELVKAVLK